MKIVFFGNGPRAIACLEKMLYDGYVISLAIAHPQEESPREGSFASFATDHGIQVIAPEDPNSKEVLADVAFLKPDVAVLAGYGKILQQPLINIFRLMPINMHAGKLPERRGGAPLNWALLEGSDSFTVSIHQLVSGIDAGPILCERHFAIGPEDTIADLHTVANKHYPEMIVQTLRKFSDGTLKPKKQTAVGAAYYPRRFPDDGLIFWDTLTAQGIHNRIRALTVPYPCAYTYYKGSKILLVASALCTQPYYGDPGRIYQINGEEILVCAKDKCLWIKAAHCQKTGKPLSAFVSRYDRLATVSRTVEKMMISKLWID